MINRVLWKDFFPIVSYQFGLRRIVSCVWVWTGSGLGTQLISHNDIYWIWRQVLQYHLLLPHFLCWLSLAKRFECLLYYWEILLPFSAKYSTLKNAKPRRQWERGTAIKFFIGYSNIIAARFISVSQIATDNLEFDRLINYLTPMILFV